VLSLKAGGTGLNLTAASHVIHFDRWWNPAIENQATDRAFRIGQKKNVLVHKFICRGTVEERIDEMIEQKRQVAIEAIGEEDAGEVLMTEMDNDTLLEFVKLDLQQASSDY
jgi:SNF2 family DNA or RNA helicase